MALNFFGDTYMDYRLVSKLIFQHFIATGVNVINSIPMLKALIIAYLTDNSIVYSDADVNSLVVEVMKYLSVEEVSTSNINTTAQKSCKKLSKADLSTLNNFIKYANKNIQDIKLFIEKAPVAKATLQILDSPWEDYCDESIELLDKVENLYEVIESFVADSGEQSV